MAKSIGEGLISGLKNYAAQKKARTDEQMNQVKMALALQQIEGMKTPAPTGYIKNPTTGAWVPDRMVAPPLNALNQEKLKIAQRENALAESSNPVPLGSGVTPLGDSSQYVPIVNPTTGKVQMKPNKDYVQKKSIPSAQIKDIYSAQRAIGQLKNIQGILGKNKEIETGPLALRFQKGMLGVPNLWMQSEGTIPESNLKKSAESFTNEYLTLSTGAQRGFKEIQWLSTAIPNLSQDVRPKYEAALNEKLKEIERNKGMMFAILQNAGYPAEQVNEELSKFEKMQQEAEEMASNATGGGEVKPISSGKYQAGQVILKGGKKYKVTGGDMNDPDVEEVI